MSDGRNPQIFIAKLPQNISERELEYEFHKFGKIKELQLKRGYAFVTYGNYEDAEKAIKKMDGEKVNGQRIVVQSALGRKRFRKRSRSSSSSKDSSSYSYRERDRRMMRHIGPQSDDICYNCGKTGHWANECREPIKPKGRYFKDEGRCYQCGEKGHIERYCPNKRYKERNKRSPRRSPSSSSSSGSRSSSDSRGRRSRRRRRRYSSKSSSSRSSDTSNSKSSRSRSSSSRSNSESSKSRSKSSEKSKSRSSSNKEEKEIHADTNKEDNPGNQPSTKTAPSSSLQQEENKEAANK